jgi:hypothetical protein
MQKIASNLGLSITGGQPRTPQLSQVRAALREIFVDLQTLYPIRLGPQSGQTVNRHLAISRLADAETEFASQHGNLRVAISHQLA